jgi:hypothetical protein
MKERRERKNKLFNNLTPENKAYREGLWTEE